MNENQAIELLPCPFCGAEAQIIVKEHRALPDGYDVACRTHGCYLEDGADWWMDRNEIITLWNTRKEPENA